MKAYIGVTIIAVFLFSACSGGKIVSQYSLNNKVIQEERNYFRNEELKISIDFLGKETVSSEISKKEYSPHKKLIQRYFPELRVNENNFLVSAKVEGGTDYLYPYYSYSTTYCFPLNETINYQAQTDERTKCVLHPYKSDKHTYLHVACMNKHIPHVNKNKKTSYWVKAFANDEDTITKSYAFDEHYKIHQPKNPFELHYITEKDSANYLRTILKYQKRSPNYVSKRERWNYLQAALSYHTFVQNNDERTKLRSELYEKATPVEQKDVLYTDSLALNYLVQQCENRTIVMLNETHWESKCRYLGNILLTELYKQGFRYLAVEAIWEQQDLLNQRKYPLQNTGMYTKDPVFCNMLRNAMQMGYTLVSYDSFEGDRDFNQAKNIYTKTIERDSLAKVLVYAGHGHIMKDSSRNLTMGYHLKKMSGINPLSIEQALFESKSNFMDSSYLCVLQNNNTNYDIVLVNNYTYPEISTTPGKKSVDFDIHLSNNVKESLNKDANLIATVYIKNEFANHRYNAVPVLNYCLNKQHLVGLSFQLPAEEYTFIVRSEYGKLIQQNDLLRIDSRGKN